MAEYFRIGEPVGAPPAGKKVILCDTDGTFKSMDSTGAKAGLGGGGGSVVSVVAGTGISVNAADPANPIVSATTAAALNWRASMFNFAKALSGLIAEDDNIEFLGGTVNDFQATIPTGGAATLVGVNGGAVLLDTGAVANDQVIVGRLNSALHVSNMKTTGPWFAASRAKYVTAVDATTASEIACFSTVNQSASAGIGVFGSQSTAFLVLHCYNGGSQTFAISNVPIDTVERDYACFFDGTTLRGYTGDVLAGTLTELNVTITSLVNFPSAGGRATTWIFNGAGALSRQIQARNLYGAWAF